MRQELRLERQAFLAAGGTMEDWKEFRRQQKALRTLSITPQQRLARIAEIIEGVDNRCAAADGPVTPTLQEMRQEEISEIYDLAKGKE